MSISRAVAESTATNNVLTSNGDVARPWTAPRPPPKLQVPRGIPGAMTRHESSPWSVDRRRPMSPHTSTMAPAGASTASTPTRAAAVQRGEDVVVAAGGGVAERTDVDAGDPAAPAHERLELGYRRGGRRRRRGRGRLHRGCHDRGCRIRRWGRPAGDRYEHCRQCQ